MTESKADKHTRLTSVMGQIKHRKDNREATKGKFGALRKEVQNYETQLADLERDITTLEDSQRSLLEELQNAPATPVPEKEEPESCGEPAVGDAAPIQPKVSSPAEEASTGHLIPTMRLPRLWWPWIAPSACGRGRPYGSDAGSTNSKSGSQRHGSPPASSARASLDRLERHQVGPCRGVGGG